MPAFNRPVGSFGESEHITVSDELAPFYRAHPAYVEVAAVGDQWVPVDEAAAAQAELDERLEVTEQVADLKGDALEAAAKAAGVEAPSTLSADEKRQAIVDKKLAGQKAADDYDQES